MPICFTNTEPFKIISLSDSALEAADIPDHIVHKYSLTRDINDLPMDKLAPFNPAIFTALPMKISHEGATDDMSPVAARAMFRDHIIEIENVPPEMRRKDPKTGHLASSVVDSYPISTINEMVSTIMQAQDRVPGGDVPFSPTAWGSYSTRKTLIRRKTHLATMELNVGGGDVPPNA